MPTAVFYFRIYDPYAVFKEISIPAILVLTNIFGLAFTQTTRLFCMSKILLEVTKRPIVMQLYIKFFQNMISLVLSTLTQKEYEFEITVSLTIF